MHELTIKGQVCQFNFGMGFLRDMNKKITAPVDGLSGVKQNVGLRYAIAKVIDGDVESLVDVLDTANKGCNPRLTRASLDDFVDDEDTDIDEVFEQVLGFLKTANATKKITVAVLEAVEEANQKAAREAAN